MYTRFTSTKKLHAYQWQGLNQSGELCHGSLQAINQLEAKAQLIRQGMVFEGLKVKKIYNIKLLPQTQKICSKDIVFFSRQLATLLAAGIPLLKCLLIIKDAQTKAAIKNLITSLSMHLETGKTLAESFKKYPMYFSVLDCNLVNLGEKSGALIIILRNLAEYKEKLATAKRKLIKALIYPLTTLILALLITVGLIIFVIPEFATFFNSFNAKLPFLTKIILEFSILCRQYLCYFIGIFSLVTVIGYFMRYSLNFMEYIHKFVLECPIFGTILTQIIMIRFCSTLVITLTAGMPLIRALHFAFSITNNTVYVKQENIIIQAVSNGQSLSRALSMSKLYPTFMINMLAVGEESSDVLQMLNKIADYYKEEVNYKLDTINILLEPLLMLIIALIVGGLLLTLYTPILKLAEII